MDVVAAAIAVAAFAATVFVLTGALSGVRREPLRTIPRAELDPESDEWLTTDQLADELHVRPGEIMNLVERRAVPFFLIAGANRYDPDSYRFQRDEIEDWTVG
jgi:hypothetical protein